MESFSSIKLFQGVPFAKAGMFYRPQASGDVLPARSWDCAQVWSKARSLGGHLGAISLLRVFSAKAGLEEIGQICA